MRSVNIASFKSRLSQYLGRVEQGEEFRLCKRNLPLARLVPEAPPETVNRTLLGCGAGTAQVKCDLTEPALDEGDWGMRREAQ